MSVNTLKCECNRKKFTESALDPGPVNKLIDELEQISTYYPETPVIYTPKYALCNYVEYIS